MNWPEFHLRCFLNNHNLNYVGVFQNYPQVPLPLGRHLPSLVIYVQAMELSNSFSFLVFCPGVLQTQSFFKESLRPNGSIAEAWRKTQCDSSIRCIRCCGAVSSDDDAHCKGSWAKELCWSSNCWSTQSHQIRIENKGLLRVEGYITSRTENEKV